MAAPEFTFDLPGPACSNDRDLQSSALTQDFRQRDMDFFCSTIIPTINRATLSRAVYSVLDQDFTAANFEVIVVNDSGQPLPDVAWQRSERVQVVNTNHRERSVARNTGAAIARGKYLHFLDDDDTLLPGALDALWELTRRAGPTAWLIGAWRSVDNEGRPIHDFQSEMCGDILAPLVCGEGLPLQASLVGADEFFAVGAFDPDPTLLGVEDRDLGRRLAFSRDVARTPVLVAQIRAGREGSSTNWASIAEGDRWGREKLLRTYDAFSRLCSSTRSVYWRGRVSRAYFASMAWNLKRGRLLTAVIRACAGVAFMNLHVFSSDYWRGLRTKIR